MTRLDKALMCVGMAGFYLFSLASSTNWFYDAPRALFQLAGSASASASAPATPVSFIADLRSQEKKAAQLQEDKDPMGIEPSSEENSNEPTNNEASPTFVQKKISKILTKLRLIAQLKNAYHYKPEEHEHESNISFTSQEVDTQTTPKNLDKEELNIEPRVVNVKSPNIQQIASHGPETNPLVFPKNEPTKISLEVNRINDKLQDFENTRNGKVHHASEPNRLGNLGVFFAELVGSIVGLTYGAVAQITSGGQSPVTVSTSEGL